ncbi:MAG: hypothetical protein ACRYGK_18405 [Janthinobacterium lividum]
MKQAIFTAFMAVLFGTALGGCTTANVVRGPMAVGADIGGLDGVVGKPAKP